MVKRHERPKEPIDNTVLSEANLMVRYNAGRYMAWWEMAQIYMKRKQYVRAKFALERYMASPQLSLNAECIYSQLLLRSDKVHACRLILQSLCERGLQNILKPKCKSHPGMAPLLLVELPANFKMLKIETGLYWRHG